jgi:hypothetical protein
MAAFATEPGTKSLALAPRTALSGKDVIVLTDGW